MHSESGDDNDDDEVYIIPGVCLFVCLFVCMLATSREYY